MPSEKGPFRCDNCEYYSARKCDNQKVIGWAKKGLYGLTLSKDGLVNVDPGGCSDEFEKR